MEDEENFLTVPTTISPSKEIANFDGEDLSDVEEGELQEPSQFEEEDDEDGS